VATAIKPARRAARARAWRPRRHEDVVVAIDGSGGARRALAVGRELSQRLLLELRVVIASGDRHPPQVEFSSEQLEPQLAELDVREDQRPALDALVDGSDSGGILILGRRHLRGAPALGSVRERVAHRAACSVLAVR
jgi:nucleotide-binding universal stress UspA family protein